MPSQSTRRPASFFASWIAIDPTPPAAPISSTVLPRSAPEREMPSRSNKPFPRGQRGERQRGRGGEAQLARLVTDDALVDDVVFAVRTGLVDAARVVDLVARLEQLHARADFADDAGRIPAENPRQLRVRIGPGADLVVHGIDGDRFDLDQQLASPTVPASALRGRRATPDRRSGGCGRVQLPSSEYDSRQDRQERQEEF